MATGVGLRVAEDACTAVIVTDGDEEPRYIVRESILHMSEDGDAELGGPASAGHAHSITGFVPAVGDPAGISVDDGEAYRAEDLVATALFCLINLAAEHLSGPAEFYATHPADWTAEHVRSLRDALDYLGLRSVLLVSEGELPSAETGAGGDSFAYDAARGALAAVLATPAGATPPDPSTAENSTVDTIVIPAVPSTEAQPQAYSAAFPIAEPIGAVAAEPEPSEKPTRAAVPAQEPRRMPLLIAGAALIGLVLGGIVVALLFRDSGDTPVPPLPDAQSEQTSVPAPPPPPVTSATTPTTAEQPEPPVVITETTTPETTTPPPPTSEPPPTTTTPPTTTRSSTVRGTTTTGYPYPQLPQIPTIPGMGIPSSR
ncbi:MULTISPECIES: hypothetical protein [Nocardia]|uniref:hypothetical protein n=1 Tax=Nocardia abscessus TaxID=120957 RepID=UPI0018942842|nr:hypothetical protein [Nocardia abscessus]MBF6472903.1 hypothetical protein [Nocardia abscessus]